MVTVNPHLVRGGLLGLALVCLGGCGSTEGLPPVFGAVFGVAGARVDPYEIGKVPELPVGPGDSVVGTAANSPGNCIWRNGENRRFRAACPEGYRV